MADSDEYEPCETLVEFLQLKGSVGLLALLFERPRTYSELESEIEITSSTISRRRDDADHLGLLTVELESDEHGTKHVYTLTDLGQYVAERMANKGIISSYYQMRDRQKEIEQKTDEIVEWVADNPTNFIQFEAVREERIAPREDTGVPSELQDVQDTKGNTAEGADTGDTGEETGTDDDTDQPETDSDESSERPRPPSERIPDRSTGSSENKTQGTFEDITAEESEQTDDEPDS